MNIIAFGAHPDDIEIGVGGTLSKLSAAGHNVVTVLVTLPNNQELRMKEAIAASKILGIELRILDLEPSVLKNSRELVGLFDQLLNEYKPDSIFTHWKFDSHQDHVDITSAVIASTRKNKCSVYMYEPTIPGGITPHGFRSQLYVDITDTIEKKIKGVLAHSSQVSNNTDYWVEGIEGRARHHGYQIGVKFAECFEIIKQRDIF
tara:strand:+ start:334 stop:945 length:612 start_codon:yes stop_codon:yes gene_type:complete